MSVDRETAAADIVLAVGDVDPSVTAIVTVAVEAIKVSEGVRVRYSKRRFAPTAVTVRFADARRTGLIVSGPLILASGNLSTSVTCQREWYSDDEVPAWLAETVAKATAAAGRAYRRSGATLIEGASEHTNGA